MVGCKPSTEDTKSRDENHSNAVKELDSAQFDLTEREIDVGYENDKYRYRITPFVDSIKALWASMLVLDKADTVFCKHITSDSVMNVIRKQQLSLNDVSEIVLEGYRMVSIMPTTSIRGYNSYADAWFVKPGAEDIVIRFTVKVFHKGHKLRIQTTHLVAVEM